MARRCWEKALMTSPLFCTLGLLAIIVFTLVNACVGRPFYPLPSKQDVGNRQPIQTFRPYNIAHRGSNGELPEETAAAYMRAIEEGADFIETDILATKDGALICFHDVYLDDITNVIHHKEFADRKRTYEVQGSNTTGFFTVDFTLEEIKTLRVNQRYKFRDQSYNGKFPIITFEEYIAIAIDAPRIVGIYPEIKNPVFINEHVKWADGKRFEDKFIETLQKYGYKGEYMSKDWLSQPIFIQSFAPSSLIYVSNLTDSPKIFLIDDVNVPTQDTNQVNDGLGHDFYSQPLHVGDFLGKTSLLMKFARMCAHSVAARREEILLFSVDPRKTILLTNTNVSYSEITSDAYFDYIKQYVVGIGPWKDTVVPPIENHLTTTTDLVAKAHAHDLQVHPYTYRNEFMFLHFNFHQDPYAEYDYWINKIGIDGLFTDFTGSLHNFQDWTSHSSKNKKSEV